MGEMEFGRDYSAPNSVQSHGLALDVCNYTHPGSTAENVPRTNCDRPAPRDGLRSNNLPLGRNGATPPARGAAASP